MSLANNDLVDIRTNLKPSDLSFVKSNTLPIGQRPQIPSVNMQYGGRGLPTFGWNTLIGVGLACAVAVEVYLIIRRTRQS